MNCQAAIGVFDSGLGGLTVVSRLMKAMPDEKIVYFGDTLRVPYGPKPPETITRYSVEALDFLSGKNVKAVAVACNTITVTCLDVLKKRISAPVFGITEPGAAAVSDALNKKRISAPVFGITEPGAAAVSDALDSCSARAGQNPEIVVIATKRTVSSGEYERLLTEKINGASVISKACPLFVPLVEEGIVEGGLAGSAVSHYLSEFKGRDISAILLGCTHYPLLLKEIQAFFGDGVLVIDPAVMLAKQIRSYLDENGLRRSGKEPPAHEFYLSDNSAGFQYVSRLALGREYGFKVVSIGS